jgi:hypothetical protein
MARAKFVRVTIPRNKVIVSKEKMKPTRHIMTARGFMAGRRNVPAVQSDKTGFIRVKSPIDVNKDGDTNDKVDIQKGQIIGRLPRGISKKPKRITINRHWSNGRIVKTHSRKIR